MSEPRPWVSGPAGGQTQGAAASPPDAPGLRNLALLAAGLTATAAVLAVSALNDQTSAPSAAAPPTIAQAAPAAAPPTLAQAAPAATPPTPAGVIAPASAAHVSAPRLAPAPVARAAPPPVRVAAATPPPAPTPLPAIPVQPAPAPAQTALSSAETLPQTQAVPQPASCAINTQSLFMPLTQGVVTAIEDPMLSMGRIRTIEAATKGNIDPLYATTLRVVVRPLGGGGSYISALPQGLVVRVGDRVSMVSGFRNLNLPCNYVPPHVTADLGPAKPAAPAAAATSAAGTPPRP